MDPTAAAVGSPTTWGTVGFWELDLGTDELYWSTQVFQIVGLSEASMSAFRARVHPDDLALVDHVWLRAQEQAGPYRAEHRFLRDGHLCALSHRIQSVPGPDGRPTRLLGVVSDVTEVRSVQAEVDAARSIRNIGLVATSLVHDFKNQLAIVLGHSKLALDAHDRDECPERSSLEAIQRAATQGTELTRQILELGRSRPAAVGAVLPATVVERVAALAEAIVGRERPLEVDIERSEGAVIADAGRLEQVLIDLVLNAADALPGSGGQVTIGYRETEIAAGRHPGDQLSPGRYGSFSVTDDGAGMDEATRRRATEAFFTTKDRNAGSGIGLASAKAFAEELGGGLAIESTPGAGTTVEVLLPLISTRRARRGTAVRLVLHVDEANLRQEWARWLRTASIQVVVAEDWSDVDRSLRTEPIDGLVVSGLLPPGRAAGGTVPVISLSPDATEAELTASVGQILAVGPR